MEGRREERGKGRREKAREEEGSRGNGNRWKVKE